MRRRATPAAPHALRRGLLVVAVASGCALAAPAPAGASILKPVCEGLGWLSGLAGKACDAAQNSGNLLQAGKKLVTGHIGGALKAAAGAGGSRASVAVGLAAVGAWVTGGAKYALRETAKLVGHSTAPQLRSTWFSAAYWRMAAVAALLTLPFLFAAAIQAMLRSDMSLLARAALGYLPLALISVGIAAPVAMLLLSACDEMSAIVASAAGHQSTSFLGRAATMLGGSLLAASPFLIFMVALFTALAALAVWVELAMRAAGVYVIVLMLPLAFAALVWPARRIWAVRAVELLVALILSKFAIVAVLSLGGAGLLQIENGGVIASLAGAVLLLLASFSPWAIIKLVPLSEMASGAASDPLGGELRGRAGPALTQAMIGGAQADRLAGGSVVSDAVLGSLSPPAPMLMRPEGEGESRDDGKAGDGTGEARESRRETGGAEGAAPAAPPVAAAAPSASADTAGNETGSAARGDPPDPLPPLRYKPEIEIPVDGRPFPSGLAGDEPPAAPEPGDHDDSNPLPRPQEREDGPL